MSFCLFWPDKRHTKTRLWETRAWKWTTRDATAAEPPRYGATQEASDPADLEIGLAGPRTAKAAARANQLLYRVRVRYTTLRGGAGTEPERKILMGYAVK